MQIHAFTVIFIRVMFLKRHLYYRL